jgi:hypothetical protein
LAGACTHFSQTFGYGHLFIRFSEPTLEVLPPGQQRELSGGAVIFLVPFREFDPVSVYVSFHDVGKLVLAQEFPQDLMSTFALTFAWEDRII